MAAGTSGGLLRHEIGAERENESESEWDRWVGGWAQAKVRPQQDPYTADVCVLLAFARAFVGEGTGFLVTSKVVPMRMREAGTWVHQQGGFSCSDGGRPMNLATTLDRTRALGGWKGLIGVCVGGLTSQVEPVTVTYLSAKGPNTPPPRGGRKKKGGSRASGSGGMLDGQAVSARYVRSAPPTAAGT